MIINCIKCMRWLKKAFSPLSVFLLLPVVDTCILYKFMRPALSHLQRNGSYKGLTFTYVPPFPEYLYIDDIKKIMFSLHVL